MEISIINQRSGRFKALMSILPISTTFLTFGHNYNQPTNLPNNIKYVIFGNRYNQPTTLPLSIFFIKFGRDYHQPTILPSNIKYVFFGRNFNQPIDLPHSIINLSLGYYYNQPDTILPPYLQNFHFENINNYDQYKDQLMKNRYLVYTNISDEDEDISKHIDINGHNLTKLAMNLLSQCLCVIDEHDVDGC